MIAIRYEPTTSPNRSGIGAAFRVLANDQPIGTVSQKSWLGWRAVSESGTVLPGVFMQRVDGADALVEWSGILDR